ncbi:probable serine/threonine-protein kinase SIS8 isoform X2 [Vigna angularis]|uniref:probable serine/threonine-protein kinase SIS8 isoform X2 n=1 Tax=Phaseolus angularis TaxID=3914 RepID=UPI0022B5C946|nr:probable serine/threonine-protein kinase SIS8 isoform X2 [Vigna angularis]
MKNILKKLHIMSNQSDDAQGATSSKSTKSSDGSSSTTPKKLSNWLHSVSNRQSPSPPSPNLARGERMDPSDSVSSGGLDVVSDSARRDSESSASRDPEVEEEYQIQLALELSAKEDPEAVQIEAVKQISLGSCDPDNTPAEVVAYRYWNYNALGYDDKISDGFYDLYGILTESTSARMPSLVDLQGKSTSVDVTWEAVLVNRAADSNLLKLEQEAMKMAASSGKDFEVVVNSNLVHKLAIMVADYMGGSVKDPESMSRAWRSLSYSLKATLGSMVLPLGSLTIGLARHRALLFKVLADSLGIPCRLVKGLQYMGSDDVAMNFVKIDDGREYIVDLMAAPGALIPSDATASHIECDGSSFVASPSSRELDSSNVASLSSGVGSSSEETSDCGGKESGLSEFATGKEDLKKPSNESKSTPYAEKIRVKDSSGRTNYPYTHGRSPSWTEGISSPAARRMKVKDVSQYMIDAAKENPNLAQKLHDVLLESGVVAPPNLFSEMYHGQLGTPTGTNFPTEQKDENKQPSVQQEIKIDDNLVPARFLPPLPYHKILRKAVPGSHLDSKPVDGLGFGLPLDTGETVGQNIPSQAEAARAKYGKNVPVAAAAAAAAAVVASSMVVAATKSNTDSNLEIPVAAAATATAAAVVATTAAVSKYEQDSRSDGDTEGGGSESKGSGDGEPNPLGENSEGERKSDRSVSNDSNKSDSALDEVAEYDIPWEEIKMGERIGLGSYGEVYRGEWHGTEVAVKKFLYQDISGELLEEFKSEARGMNYLHSSTPVIVHRDLKSPNLLVDKNWVVKVCDFGLSRMKHSTFLSSRSTAGTAEWMAPEVLRNELSDEKCDVFSYGVILWELSTLQQPWGGMNPMQVVGAVGFQHRRLDIPDDVDPAIADIIRQCWQTDPKLRPTFAEIMAALKPLQRPITASQVPRSSAQSSRVTEFPAG